MREKTAFGVDDTASIDGEEVRIDRDSESRPMSMDDVLAGFGIDDKIEITLLRFDDEDQWRATGDGSTEWADSPADALAALAETLRDR